VKVRNLCLRWGINQSKYLGLCGTYPDDIAIQMFPVVKSIQCVERDPIVCEEMAQFSARWVELTGLGLSYIQGNILDLHSTARVNDLDFMCPWDEELCDRVLSFVSNIQLSGPVCVELWTPYGRGPKGEITKANQEQLLSSLISRIGEVVNVLDGFNTSYVDNHVPILHQTLIIERRSL
jgi:hypothetical protein